MNHQIEPTGNAFECLPSQVTLGFGSLDVSSARSWLLVVWYFHDIRWQWLDSQYSDVYLIHTSSKSWWQARREIDKRARFAARDANNRIAKVSTQTFLLLPAFLLCAALVLAIMKAPSSSALSSEVSSSCRATFQPPVDITASGGGPPRSAHAEGEEVLSSCEPG